MGVKLRPYIEPKLIIYLFGFYTFIALVDFIRVYLMYYTSNRTLESLLDLALIIALDWVFVICFMSLVSIGTKYLLTIKVKWSWIIVLHAILSFVQSFAVSFISPLVLGEIPSRPELTVLDRVWQIFFTNVTTNVLLYSTIILIIYMYFYLKQVKHQEQKNKILENSLIRFKLKSLENQLNPHFLFNSLNTVSSLIGSNKKQAQDMLADISELFRKYLDNNHSNWQTELR